MANSSNFSTDNGYIVFWISCVENSYSIPNNTSSVTVNVYCKRTNTGYTTYGSGTTYLTIDGISYTAPITTAMTITSTSRLMFSKTVTVAHSATGAETLTMQADISHSMFAGNVGTYNQALTTIPRTSSITTFSNFTISGTVPITIYRYSSTFTHNLTLKIGTVTVASRTGIATNGNMTLSVAENNILYSNMASVSSATVILYCATMSGSTQIGSTVSKTATATVSTSVVPTLTSITATGVNATTGTYIKNITPITFSVNGGAGASYSTITNYKVVFNGITYSSPTAWQALTGLINASGVVTATGTVTDSRGRTASRTIDITLIDYTTPTISGFTVQRADSDGTPFVMGEFAKITTVGGVKSLVNGTEKNLLTYNVFSKLRSATDWGTAIKTATSGLSLNTSVTLGTYLATNSYDFKLEVKDIFNTVISTVVVSTALVTMSWGVTGVGIGKVWEAGALDVGGDINLTGSLNMNKVNAGIELGSPSTNTPFIDFHSGATLCDYDSRIIASGGTGTTGAGVLQLVASKVNATSIALTSHMYMGDSDGSMFLSGTNQFNLSSTSGYAHLKVDNASVYIDATVHYFRDGDGTNKVKMSLDGDDVLLWIATDYDQFFFQKHVRLKSTASIFCETGNVVSCGLNATQAFKTMYSYAYNAGSNRSFKKNIAKIDNTNSYDLIKNMNTYQYNYNEDDRVMIGIITDEAPLEVVEQDEFKSINLYSLSTLTISAVKEIMLKVESLEKQVELLGGIV